MKLVAAVLIGVLAGIVPAEAQTSYTRTFTPTPTGGQATTTFSDGSSVTTTNNGSTMTTTYRPPGSAYMPMGQSGYNPMGHR
jgi:hypothetical protein